MKISLITVCYNSEATIKDTFNSVLNQTYDDIEYIIVDGASQDSTISIINEYLPVFKERGITTKFSSEKDNGLFDAMNKGVAKSTGDVVGIINSDDVIHDKNALKKIAYRFEHENCDATYSDIYLMDYKTMSRPNRIFIAGKKNYKLGWYPPHPSLYVKKQVYEKYGVYDTKYSMSADYDFMLKLMENGVKMSYINEPLIYMRFGGVSTGSFKGYKKSFDDSVRVLKKHNIRFSYLVNLLRTFVILKQRLMGIFKIKFVPDNGEDEVVL